MVIREKVSLGNLSRECDVLLMCPSAMLNHLRRDKKGPSIEGQPDFMKSLIEAIDNDSDIYTTRHIKEGILLHPNYEKYVHSAKSTEIERKNYEFVKDLAEKFEAKERILDLDKSKDIIGKCREHFDIFYSIGKRFLLERDKKKRFCFDWLTIPSAKKHVYWADLIGRQEINHIKADLFATSLTLINGGRTYVATNDFGLLDLYKFSLGNIGSKGNNLKVFARRGIHDFDEMII